MDLRSIGMAALAALVMAVLPGCQSEDEACPRVSGFFEATYVQRAGSCSPSFEALPVDFSGGRGGVATAIQRRVNDRVETMIVMKGCTLRMAQTLIGNDNRRIAHVEGEEIVIESENELSGVVLRQEFDDQGQAICTGEYDALYTKNTVTIAAAALD